MYSAARSERPAGERRRPLPGSGVGPPADMSCLGHRPAGCDVTALCAVRYVGRITRVSWRNGGGGGMQDVRCCVCGDAVVDKLYDDL